MVQRLNPVKTQVVTKDGECSVTITLELNINVNGEVGVQAQAVASKVEDEKPQFVMPDFSSGTKLQNF